MESRSYAELARKLLEFEDRPHELLALLRDFAARGLQMGSIKDQDAEGYSVPESDPFTLIASFRWQAHKPEKHRAILAAL